jgi:hypothetical protein
MNINYDHWISHFEINRKHRQEPDWSAPFTTSERKRAALARSLAEYQLGDGGGECRLIANDASSVRGIDERAAQVIDLWFNEEREHSRLLSHAVRRVSGTFVTTTFAFRLFNRVRQWFGVQFEMLVLLVVEIVSTGYYRMIQRHCDDQPITAMCALILRDELGHIAFHSSRLSGGRPVWRMPWWHLYFLLLGEACATFLWFGHGRDLRAIGATRAEFMREVREGMTDFLAGLCRAEGKVARIQTDKLPALLQTSAR